MKMKFKLGRVVVTQGAHEKVSLDDMQIALLRHQKGDWGNVPPEDAELNNQAIQGEPDDQGRVLSSYKDSNGTKFWIITEWDRSYTTILLPSEY